MSELTTYQQPAPIADYQSRAIDRLGAWAQSADAAYAVAPSCWAQVLPRVRERHPEIDVDADRLHIRWRALVDEHHEPVAETAGGPTLPELRRGSFA